LAIEQLSKQLQIHPKMQQLTKWKKYPETRATVLGDGATARSDGKTCAKRMAKRSSDDATDATDTTVTDATDATNTTTVPPLKKKKTRTVSSEKRQVFLVLKDSRDPQKMDETQTVAMQDAGHRVADLVGLSVTRKEAPKEGFWEIYAGWGDDKIREQAQSTSDDLRLYPGCPPGYDPLDCTSVYM